MSRLLLAFLLQASLLSAASAQTIGLAMPRTDDTFRSTISKGVQAAAQAAGFKIDLSDAQNDPGLQVTNVRRQIAAGVSALVVVGLDANSEREIAKLAADAKVPAVFVNHQPDQALLGAGAAYVGSEEKVAGALQAGEVCRALGGKGTAVIMIGELNHPAAKVRTRTVHETFATPECRGIEILEEQAGNWDRTEGQSLMQSFLDGGLKPDAVIANNDEMALGAADSLRSAGVKSFVVGIDATDDALAAMGKGELSVTVLQDGGAQGALAVDVARRMLAGEAVEPLNWVPFKLVLPSDASALIAQRSAR